jgi:peptidoglycan/LPS O-acetylase OafA/YrhL
MGAPYRFSGQARALRGLVLGAIVLLLTAVAHNSGDHAAPPVGTTALLWLLPLTVMLSVLAADRRRDRAWLVAYLLGMQALLHVLLVVSAGHASHGGSMLPPWSMIVMHVVAAASAAVLIAHADALLHAWLRFLYSLTRDYRPTLPARPTPPRAPTALAPAPGHPSGKVLGLTPLRRGPPVCTLA